MSENRNEKEEIQNLSETRPCAEFPSNDFRQEENLPEEKRVNDGIEENSPGGFNDSQSTMAFSRANDAGEKNFQEFQDLESSSSLLNRNTNIWAETLPCSSLNSGRDSSVLWRNYLALTGSKNISNQENLSLDYVLGKGNQGVVFHSMRIGTDSFRLPIALKFFTPESFKLESRYEEAMNYCAKVASAVAQIQHDNLTTVRDWFTLNGIRVMEMDLVDGYDLSQLMSNDVLFWMRQHLEKDDYEFKTKVILDYGPVRPRFKPGVALAIIRDCLNALAALHAAGIVHSDIKPANIMLKKTGSTKIIDIGAAYFYEDTPPRRFCSPFYAAPEIHCRKEVLSSTPQSDIASLGYVLIELLAGRSPFECLDEANGCRIISAKSLLDQKYELIHKDVLVNDKLVNFCRRMIHPDLKIRYRTAEAAVVEHGAVAELARDLVKFNLSSEYDLDIQHWIKNLNLPRKDIPLDP